MPTNFILPLDFELTPGVTLLYKGEFMEIAEAVEII